MPPEEDFLKSNQNDQASSDKTESEQAAPEKAELDKAESGLAASEQAESDQAASEQAESDQAASEQVESDQSENPRPNEKAIFAPATNWHGKDMLFTAFLSAFFTLTFLAYIFIYLNDYIVSIVNNSIREEQIDSYIEKSLKKYLNDFSVTTTNSAINDQDKRLNDYIVSIVNNSIREEQIDSYIEKSLKKYLNDFSVTTTNSVINDQDKRLIESLANAIIAAEQTKADKKADSLVSNARLAKEEDAEKASLLYWAALDVSSSKYGILKEYVDWQKSIIGLDLDNNNYILAQERMGSLLNLIDAHLHKGTVEDLLSFTAIRDELTAIDSQITEKFNAAVALQSGEIETIKSEHLTASFSPEDREGYVQALSSLEAISPFPQVEAALEEAIELVATKLQACEALDSLDRDGGLIVAPVDTSKTVAETWLRNLGERLLASNAPVSELLVAYETGRQYQANLDFDLDGQITSQLDKAEQKFAIIIWGEQVEKLMSDLVSNPSTDQLPQLELLYNQGIVLLSSDYDLKPVMNLLATTLFRAKLLQVAEGLDNLSKLEGRYSDDLLQNLAAQYRFQVASLALEFEDANKILPELSQESTLNDSFSSLMNATTGSFESYGQQQQVLAAEKLESAKEMYQREVEKVLSLSDYYFWQAETAALGFFNTRNDETPQRHYQSAYRTLMKLSRDDVYNYAKDGQKEAYNTRLNKVRENYKNLDQDSNSNFISISFDNILKDIQ